MTSTFPYQIAVDGLPRDHFRVHSLRGRETISDVYAFDVVAAAPRDGEEIERIVLGQRAVLTWDVGRGQRAFYGIISAARADESSGALKIRLRLVPRLWLLRRKRRTRIFQKQRVPDIVNAVLLEAGIAARWQLKREHPVREYCTQYEETDLGFVRRLVAEAAIYFYFPQGPALDDAALAAAGAVTVVGSMAGAALGALAGSAASALAGEAASAAAPLVPGDTVIFSDDAAFYPPIGGDDPGELLAASAAAMVPEIGSAIGAGDTGGAVLGAASAVAGAAIAALATRPAPTLYYVSALGTATSPTDKISRFALGTSVRSDHAHFRDYDPERPMAPLRSTAFSTAPFPPTPLQAALAGTADVGGVAGSISTGGAVGEVAGLVTGAASAVAGAEAALLGQPAPSSLEVYEHHGPFLFPKWGFMHDEAARILRQKRRRAAVAAGKSGCPALAPGHRFVLSDHPASHLDRPYVATVVEHRGSAHWQEVDADPLYACSFECVPAEVTYVPPRPKRRSIQVALTATVVGPLGEEIHVDPMGQIKVQFHWDRQGAYDDHSSCWIRTMHPWGGAGWGVQFIPRVGMEVVVTFEGGDPDKPMVLGALYNGTHPSPFPLPADKSRSGWRTNTYPGGHGFNELSFEDARDKEQVYLHAQRDHDEVVRRDHTLHVGHDETMEIGHDQRLAVGHDRFERVGGSRTETVALHQTERIGGNCDETIEQDHALRVTGTQSIVSLDAQRTTRRHHETVVGGNERLEVAGRANQHVQADLTTRVDGNYTTVVGKHDARRTFVVHAEGRAVLSSSDLTEVRSEKELVFSCGTSRIRLTPDRIELSSQAGLSLRSGSTVVEVMPDKARIRSKGKAIISAQSVNVLTDQAQVKLTDEVKIKGTMVKLNPPTSDTDKDDDPKPPKLTKLDFKDQDGRPLANQRFVIHLDDGSEVAGVLDHEGRAELEIEGNNAEITFPDTADVKPG